MSSVDKGIDTASKYAEDIAQWSRKGRELMLSSVETLDDGREPKEVAEQFFERALRYDPTHQESLLFLTELYLHSARGTLMTKRLTRLIRDYPEQFGPYRAIVACLRASGKIETAVHFFESRLKNSTEGKANAHLCLAELYAILGDTASLQAHCSALMDYAPVEPITQAQLFLEYNDANGIFSLAEKVEELPIKHTLWGMMMEAQGDSQKAGEYFFSAASSEAPPWYALNALANMWLQAKNIDYAQAYLEQVEQMAGTTPEVLLTRMRMYKAKDLMDKAQALQHRILQLNSCLPRTKRLARQF